MVNTDYENADGGIINYEVANGFQNIGNNYFENGLNNKSMSFADGGADEDFYSANGDDDFYSADGDEDFYNAKGRKKGKSKFAKFWSYTPLGMLKDGIDRRNSPEGLARRDKRNKSREEARSGRVKGRQTKADAKVKSAEAQKLSAESLGKGVEGDIALAKALEVKPEAVSGGMSKGMKTGLIVGGVLLVLGVVGFIVYKKMGAKKLGK